MARPAPPAAELTPCMPDPLVVFHGGQDRPSLPGDSEPRYYLHQGTSLGSIPHGRPRKREDRDAILEPCVGNSQDQEKGRCR